MKRLLCSIMFGAGLTSLVLLSQADRIYKLSGDDKTHVEIVHLGTAICIIAVAVYCLLEMWKKDVD